MDPGTGLAVASLTFQVFAGCIQGFVAITDAWNLQKDSAKERTKLLIQEHRLVEWARAVNIYTPDTTVASWLNQVPATAIIVQLSELLNSTETLRKRYGIELRVAEPTDVNTAAANVLKGDEQILSAFAPQHGRNVILQQASRLSKVAYVPKRIWWASVDKHKYETLVKDVTSLVDGLWALLTPALQVQSSQATNEILRHIIRLSKDVGELRDLQGSLQSTQGQTGSSDVQASLAASAGIRAMTLSLNISQRETNDQRPNNTRPVAMLSTASVTDEVMGPSAFGIARHGDLKFITEHRTVDAPLKRKLRTRVADLATLLSDHPTPNFLTLRCIGFNEVPMGFRLVFEQPAGIAAPLTSPPQTLLEVFGRRPSPAAGTRLSLVLKVAGTILSFHNAGWLHKDIRSANIMVVTTADGPSMAPYLGGFSFSRKDSPLEISEDPRADWAEEIYRHPDAQESGRQDVGSFQRYMDSYAMGCVLLEIAEWAPLRKIVKSSEAEKVKEYLVRRYVQERKADFLLGEAFGKMIRCCINSQEGDTDLREMQYVLEEVSRCRI